MYTHSWIGPLDSNAKVMEPGSNTAVMEPGSQHTLLHCIIIFAGQQSTPCSNRIELRKIADLQNVYLCVMLILHSYVPLPSGIVYSP